MDIRNDKRRNGLTLASAFKPITEEFARALLSRSHLSLKQSY